MKRTAASPIVCVASWKPAPAKRAIEAAIRSGSGQNGVSPSPCESGASSHAVPASITPSAKYFATPPRHSAPRSSRSASQASCSSSRRVRLDPQRHAQAHGQLVRALEVAQQLERLRLAVHHVRAGQPERVQPPQLRDVPRAQLRPAQRRRGAQDQLLRARLVQLAGGDAVDAHDLGPVGEVDRARDLRQLQRARRGQRAVQVAQPHEHRRAAGGRADLGGRGRGVVVQPPGEEPAAVRALAASAASTSSLRAELAELEPAGRARRPRTGGCASPPGRGRARRRARRAPPCARRRSTSSPTETIMPPRTPTALANGRAGSSVRTRALTMASSAVGMRRLRGEEVGEAGDRDHADHHRRRPDLVPGRVRAGRARRAATRR